MLLAHILGNNNRPPDTIVFTLLAIVVNIELPPATFSTILFICSLISERVASTLSNASPTAEDAVPNKNCISLALSDNAFIVVARDDSVVSLEKESWKDASELI